MTVSAAPPPSARELDELAGELASAMARSDILRGHHIGPLTTYRVGGAAGLYVEVADSADLASLVGITSQSGIPLAVLGRGSNLLVSDDGFAGLVVKLGTEFETVEELGDARVRIGGAMSLPAAARRLTAGGLGGFEWAVGVPGSLGGAVRMNAGGHGSDMAASLVAARVVDLRAGTVGDVAPAALDLAYRSSSIAVHQLVVTADLQLDPVDPEVGGAMLTEIVRWRRENQPGGQNAGSVFTNPTGDSAGRLIDAVGMKGFRIGSAEVSPKHANFIQADPGGSASDIVALMGEIVRRVEAATGIRLHAETRLLGFDDGATGPMTKGT